jgi:mRNA-degrading endonuclease RelE of RelBE toxin-antitoxin system
LLRLVLPMPESPYRLSFDRVLKKQVDELPGKLRQEARERIGALAREPRPAIAKELRGYPGIYRCWLSDARYRLIWEVNDADLLVEIYYVGLKPDYEELLGDGNGDITE